MKAGKTDNIIKTYNKYISIDKKICIINHSYDKIRTNKDNVIRTHNNFYMNALSSNSLLKVISNETYKESDVVIIDEAQFFDDLKIFVESEIDSVNKQFYIYGLSGDINRNKIGQILDIIPYADHVRHFTAYCCICKDGTPAPFTYTQEKITNQIFVGDTIYYPVCRKHYLEFK